MTPTTVLFAMEQSPKVQSSAKIDSQLASHTASTPMPCAYKRRKLSSEKSSKASVSKVYSTCFLDAACLTYDTDFSGLACALVVFSFAIRSSPSSPPWTLACALFRNNIAMASSYASRDWSVNRGYPLVACAGLDSQWFHQYVFGNRISRATSEYFSRIALFALCNIRSPCFINWSW